MKPTARVSFLVVNFNTNACLAKCLESIRLYAPIDHQIIVVDNASTDGSSNMVRGNYPEARLISMATNQGYSTAINHGLRVVDRELVFILNSDVYLRDGAVQILMEQFQSAEDLGLAGPMHFSKGNRRSLTVYQNQNLLLEFFETFLLFDLWRYRVFGESIASRMILPREVAWLSGAAMMVRASVMANVGGMDENLFLYGEEYDLQLRIRKQGWRIEFIPAAQVLHEKGASAGAHFRHKRLAAVTRSHYYVAAKHSGLWILSITVPLRLVRSVIRLILGLPVFLWRPERAKEHFLEHIEAIRTSLSRSTYSWIRDALG